MHGMAQVLVAVALFAGTLPCCQAVTSRIGMQQSTSTATTALAGLMWQGTPSPLTPTNFTVTFPFQRAAVDNTFGDGPGGPTANSRVEIHLPGFGGAYNSFGASPPSSTGTAGVLAGPFLPIQNGIRPYSRRYVTTEADPALAAANGANEALIDQCITAAEWDPKREVLKITAESGATPATVCDLDYFNGVTIDEAYLRQLFHRSGLPSGKGPLPPRGGIDETWYKKAWVRMYPAAACSGSGTNRAGLGSEECDVSATGVNEYAFNRDYSASTEFETANGWVPTQHVGAVGTMAKPGFAYLAAAGDATGKGATTCITVTMIPSVAMTSPSAAAMTDITISGLTGADTADSSALAIFAGSGCSMTPSLSDVHDNTNSIRAAVNSGAATAATAAATFSVAAGAVGGTSNGIAVADQIMSPAGLPWRGDWDQADGTLKVRIGAGMSIEAGEVVTFSFELDNSQTAQASREIFAAASGYYCTINLCTTATDSTLSVDATKFNAMSSVLEIAEPTFEVARIHQSTSTPGATATITVSLKPNTAIAGTDAEVTLSGLCGTVRNADKQMLDMFGHPLHTTSSPSTGNIEATADWDLDSKVFKFNLGATGLAADTLYVFKFTWELVDTANDACAVTIAATGSDKTFASSTMAGSVGRVAAPAFTTLKIGQTSTRPDALNFICITLETNKNFNSQSDGQQEQSKIVLTGLTGSQHKDEPGVQLYNCPSNSLQAGSNEYGFNTKNGWAMPITPQSYATLSGSAAPFAHSSGQGRFDFTAATGTAEFVMDTTGFTSGVEYVFAILVDNAKAASDCKEVTLTASGDITQTATMVQSTYARALIDGESDGDACALKVYDSGFLVKIASSSAKMADAAATVTVTLRSNLDVTSTNNGFKSSITISGLTGSKSSSSTTLADVLVGGTGNVATAFSPAFDEVSWTQASGVLELKLTESTSCVHPSGSNAKAQAQACIKAGVEYVFQFQIQNGATAQEAPALTLATNYDSGKVLTQMMDAPSSTGCTRDKPLAILSEDRLLCTAKIGQLTSAPSARNAICVTLATNQDMATTVSGDASRFVSFTITGLKDFQTDGQALTIRDIESGEMLVGDQSAGTTNTENTDRFGNVNVVHNMFCSTSDNSATGCAADQNNLITFTELTGEAAFFLAMSNTMTAGTDYAFCFHLTNPSTKAPCKTDISIKVKDSDMSTSAAVPFQMTTDAGDACPGFTTDRMFTTASIRSHSNVTSMVAGLFLELSPNHAISAGTVVTVAGLNGYMGAGQNSAGTAADVDIEVVRNGVRNTAVFGTTGTWDGTSQLTMTVQTGQTIAAKNHLANSGTVAFDGTPEHDDIYEIFFELKNSASEQAGKPITVTAADFKADGLLDSGLTSSRRSLQVAKARRAGHGGKGDLVFQFTPKKAIAGGESIILELPHYSMAVDGPVFGITSTNDAFTTYADRGDWELQGTSSSKARAVFTNGYVASGTSTSRRSQKTSGLDGFFMLATNDDNTANKNNWFTESTLWEGTLKYENVEGGSELAAGITNVVGDGVAGSETSNYNAGVAGLYAIATTTSFQGSASTTLPTSIEGDALVGMRLSCSRAQTTTFSPNIFPGSHYVTESAYILENAAGGTKIIVESLFTAAVFGTHNVDNDVLDAQCRIEYKPTVGRYTGMTVMFDNGKEYTIKQGAGALYQITDGSGSPPSAHDIEDRAYTIYSQLEITAAVGESVAAGETVTITIPGTAGITAPSDLSGPTVSMQGDSDKCMRVVASPDLNTATAMNVMTSCGYASMPTGDMSIAAKSTIRRVFASVLGASSSTGAFSTARLSTIAPYQYSDAVAPLLLGKPMDIYGSISLLSQPTATADEALNSHKLTVSGMTGSTTRTSWAREDDYAGRAFVIGQEDYGMTAPLDVNALQRVIAVADASGIDVGDYLNIGNEMMYVESKDGNYLGVQRGAVGTEATSHRASFGSDVEKEYDADEADGGAAAFTAAFGGNIAGTAVASVSADYNGIPAHGWVTIWKRDTTANSYFLTADALAAAATITIGALNGGDICDDGLGCALLVGGTSAKEFMLADVAGTATTAAGVVTVVAQAAATAVQPIVAMRRLAHSIGDSVVQYTCGWDANIAATAFATQGAGVRTNLCARTTLVGMPVIPVADGSGINPGDFLRVDYPQFTGAGGLRAVTSVGRMVQPIDEEIYRVNAVNGNDVVVTAKPLTISAAATGAANVQRHPGGTPLDLLRRTGITITYTTTTGNAVAADAADPNDAGFTVTVSSAADITAGQYCLIDSEFLRIGSINNLVVTFVDQVGAPTAFTAVNYAAGINNGRGAFGTDSAVTHPASGTCEVYTYLAGTNGQGAGRMLAEDGFTTIYDPRVVIRQMAGVDAAGQITLEAPAQELHSTASEPTQMIGDPAETHAEPFPVRGGSDFACALGVGNPVLRVTGAALTANPTQTDGATASTATDTVLQYADVSGMVEGDYLVSVTTAATDTMLVESVDATNNRVTVTRSTAALPAHPTPQCLNAVMAPAAPLIPDYLIYQCPTLGAFVATDLINAALSATATTLPMADNSGLIVGTYYKIGGEIVLVTALNAAGTAATVVRNVQIPCRPSVASAHANGAQLIPVVFPTIPEIVNSGAGALAAPFASDMEYYNTFGYDYQIDANRVKAGALYVVGALGDMLEDVNRDATVDAAAGVPGYTRNTNPNTDILGGGATSFFASPWGTGGNVTEFCYETRTGTQAKTTTLATAITAATTTTVVVAANGLNKLGVVPGDYIHVNAAADADTAVANPAAGTIGNGAVAQGVAVRSILPLQTTGEYMRVTAVNYAASSMTVIRNVVPNCLPANIDTAFNNFVVGANPAVINLVTPVYDTVQLKDSVTKHTTRVAGGAWTAGDGGSLNAAGVGSLAGAKDTGSCAVVVSTAAAGLIGATKAAIASQISPLVNIVDANTPATLPYDTIVVTAAAGPAANIEYLFPVAAGDYIMVGVDAFAGNAATHEFMLVTSVNTADGNGDGVADAAAGKAAVDFTLTVVRGVTPPCQRTGLPLAHAAASNVYKVLRDGKYADLGAQNAAASFPQGLATTANGGADFTPTSTELRVLESSDMEVGGYLKISPVTQAAGVALATEYVLITDIVNNPTAAADIITVVRNTAPKGLKSLPTTVTVPQGTVNCIMPLGNPVDGGAANGAMRLDNAAAPDITGTKPGRSNSMTSVSMRAIVELSPREPIEWVVPVVTGSSWSRGIIMQGLTLEDFATASARRATTAEYKAVLERLLELDPASERLTVSDPKAGDAPNSVEVDVGLECDSSAVCDAKKAKLDEIICNGELAAELTTLFKKAVTVDGNLNGCPADPTASDGNLLWLLLLLLLIPLGIAAYCCMKKEPEQPTGKPMAPVYLPQPYPVLPVEYAPVAAPMPMMQMSPQPIAVEYAPAQMPMMQMSPQPVMMAPMGGSPVPYGMQQPPMQYGM